VAHFNEEDQAEARELNSNLLKHYYNKSVVSRELDIRGLVLKNDIRTRDMHKFSLPWERPFIVVDIAAPRAYVLPEVDDGVLLNTWNAD
jgi:hypothetical protein